MFTLVIWACLKANAIQCGEYRMTFERPNTVYRLQKACGGVEGQTALAGWLAQHPDKVIMRWSCADVQTAKSDI